MRTHFIIIISLFALSSCRKDPESCRELKFKGESNDQLLIQLNSSDIYYSNNIIDQEFVEVSGYNTHHVFLQKFDINGDCIYDFEFSKRIISHPGINNNGNANEEGSSIRTVVSLISLNDNFEIATTQMTDIIYKSESSFQSGPDIYINTVYSTDTLDSTHQLLLKTYADIKSLDETFSSNLTWQKDSVSISHSFEQEFAENWETYVLFGTYYLDKDSSNFSLGHLNSDYFIPIKYASDRGTKLGWIQIENFFVTSTAIQK